MNILTLDGGGSKGVYTLGVLSELEAMLPVPIHETFDYIYGTSTGSIIAALLGLGWKVSAIQDLYFRLIPSIMAPLLPAIKSAVLRTELENVFGDSDFTAFKTGVGIIATNVEAERPLIFKNRVSQAYQLKSTFIPGFGATIAVAVQASCAAIPIFKKVPVKTQNQHTVIAMDGGFIANNPILIALADALNALGGSLEDTNFLSLGTGNFVEKHAPVSMFIRSLWTVRQMEKILKANANTIDILASLLFKGIKLVRVNDSFNQPQYGTNMIEKNPKKLRLLHGLGRESFGKHELKIRELLNVPTTI
jgi:predicted acylesterase/phospholipase RssA